MAEELENIQTYEDLSIELDPLELMEYYLDFGDGSDIDDDEYLSSLEASEIPTAPQQIRTPLVLPQSLKLLVPEKNDLLSPR